MKTADGLIYYSTRSATVGLVVRGGVVVDCPPYANVFARGRYARQVWRDAARRGVRLVWIPAD